MYESAMSEYSQWKDLENEENTKNIQFSPSTREIGVQTDGEGFQQTGQCNDSILNADDYTEEVSSDGVETDLDTSFFISDEEPSDSDEMTDLEETVGNVMPTKSAFVVYWSSLQPLFSKCSSCSNKSSIVKCFVKGSLLSVESLCTNGHSFTWRSQPVTKRKAHGNLKLSASVLFSANTFSSIRSYFELADVQWISKTQYYQIQKRYLSLVVNEAWLSQQRVLISELQGQEICRLSGDGRCNSPGHNAKYLTYTMLDQASNRIIAMSIVQVTEAGNSNRMEKLGFTNVLEELERKKITVKQITTDRHVQIKKYMREQKPEISHQFDVWHVCKNIKSKLVACTRKKANQSLSKWIKSICNHFWWACATSQGDEVLLREKWMSILFHIQNKHQWTGYSKFQRCEHPPLENTDERKKKWIKPTSDAFKALQEIVLSKSLLADMKHMTQFSHTGTLEVYHALYNKWLPKSLHFSYQGMLTRSQLAALDFNSGSMLKQAETNTGEKRYNVCFSKITKTWSAKPVKENKTRKHLHEMIDRTITVANHDLVLEKLHIPENMPSNIAPIPKPTKADVVNNQKSRFT